MFDVPKGQWELETSRQRAKGIEKTVNLIRSGDWCISCNLPSLHSVFLVCFVAFCLMSHTILQSPTFHAKLFYYFSCLTNSKDAVVLSNPSFRLFWHNFNLFTYQIWNELSSHWCHDSFFSLSLYLLLSCSLLPACHLTAATVRPNSMQSKQWDFSTAIWCDYVKVFFEYLNNDDIQ